VFFHVDLLLHKDAAISRVSFMQTDSAVYDET